MGPCPRADRERCTRTLQRKARTVTASFWGGAATCAHAPPPRLKLCATIRAAERVAQGGINNQLLPQYLPLHRVWSRDDEL